jgi:hypothetical protein
LLSWMCRPTATLLLALASTVTLGPHFTVRRLWEPSQISDECTVRRPLYV